MIGGNKTAELQVMTVTEGKIGSLKKWGTVQELKGFLGIFEFIGGTISGIVDLVTGVVQIICGIIQGFKDGDWSLFVEGLETLFTGFLELITAPFIAIWETFKGYTYYLK